MPFWSLAREAEPGLEFNMGGLRRSSSEGRETLGQQQGEPRSVRCECCGMAEECTPTYIGRVRERFDGKWVCGLCSEAVKERQKREPALAVGEAVEAHAGLCKRFNSTVRLNPKLSLASSMRDIARKSCQNRTALPSDSAAPEITRTNSCALPYV